MCSRCSINASFLLIRFAFKICLWSAFYAPRTWHVMPKGVRQVTRYSVMGAVVHGGSRAHANCFPKHSLSCRGIEVWGIRTGMGSCWLEKSGMKDKGILVLTWWCQGRVWGCDSFRTTQNSEDPCLSLMLVKAGEGVVLQAIIIIFAIKIFLAWDGWMGWGGLLEL